MDTLAIMVNYRAAELALTAVSSLLTSQSLGSLRIVLVDNSCDSAETATLQQHLPGSVELVNPGTNLGFGKACNLALTRCPSPYILLLNPDSRLLPGSLAELQTTLRNRPGAGAVAPQLYWDEHQTFLLPPAYPVCLFLVDLWRTRQPAGSFLSRWVERLWKRYAIRAWTARREMRMLNLSGAAVLIRRSALEPSDRLFDPRFFLYFEDSDLFLRMRRCGHQLLLNPRARAVHFYDQCGRDEWLRKRFHMAEAKQLFLEKHYSFLARRSTSPGAQPTGRSPGRTTEPSSCFHRPFEVSLPVAEPDRWLFEWSPHPDFVPAVGRFGHGPKLAFAEPDWNRLAPGTYYGRVGPLRGTGRYVTRFVWQVPDSP